MGHASIAYFTFRLIVLLLIRKSISSLRRHIEKVHPRICGSLHSWHFHVSIASSSDFWITCLLAYFLITSIFTFVNHSLEGFFFKPVFSIVVNFNVATHVGDGAVTMVPRRRSRARVDDKLRCSLSCSSSQGSCRWSSSLRDRVRFYQPWPKPTCRAWEGGAPQWSMIYIIIK